jgi:hypothetical protein
MAGMTAQSPTLHDHKSAKCGDPLAQRSVALLVRGPAYQPEVLAQQLKLLPGPRHRHLNQKQEWFLKTHAGTTSLLSDNWQRRIIRFDLPIQAWPRSSHAFAVSAALSPAASGAPRFPLEVHSH